ncbi:HprK-related kinase A [Sphingomonas bacterium]|uniref:HprK-related kinase A n=1 Tax=Sphingomonas bacterium TaxID=1895847 RepID=UPI0015755D62|nr:HprK-related kinase A [Sphingomonas bacterium]
MKHQLAVRVGPAKFRIGSAWRAPIAALSALYADYPPVTTVPDFTVRLEPTRPWRRWLRPAVAIGGDYRLPEAAPLPLAQGLLAAEMAMNLQMALGWRRHLLLHAGVVERDGRALVLTGASGSGKSTLAALLARQGWRFLGDEFALLDPATGTLAPFPRPVSLKNESIALFDGGHRWGPLLRGTPKGDIRHLVPDSEALAAMDQPATPALIVFPSFGFTEAVRAVPPSEAFVRLTQASTNYTALGEAGFAALTRLIGEVPAVAVDYPDTATALRLIDMLWSAQ